MARYAISASGSGPNFSCGPRNGFMKMGHSPRGIRGEHAGLPDGAGRGAAVVCGARWQRRHCGGRGLIENDFHNRPDLCPNVCALFVEQAYRRRGLARLLLSRAIAYARAAGAFCMTLEVRESNTPAIALYRSFGFVPVGCGRAIIRTLKRARF